jgi:hypothetical protein
MSIRKERGGMYAATIHYQGALVVFIAPTWIGAYKSASMFVFGANK